MLHSEGGWQANFDIISTDTSAQIQETRITPHTFEFLGTSIFCIFCKLFTCYLVRIRGADNLNLNMFEFEESFI